MGGNPGKARRRGKKNGTRNAQGDGAVRGGVPPRGDTPRDVPPDDRAARDSATDAGDREREAGGPQPLQADLLELVGERPESKDRSGEAATDQPPQAGTVPPPVSPAGIRSPAPAGATFPRIGRVARAVGRIALAALQLVATTLLVFALVGAASYFVLKAYVGGREVAVPNICGLTLERALEKLKPRQLYLELDRHRYSDAVPRGHIVAQFPSPGVKVKARTPVRVVVSQGAARVRAPSLVGMNEVKAGVTLRAVEQADLDVGKIARIYDDAVPEGFVIAQEPPPGTPIRRGSRINLLVSLGPRPVYFQMPDLREKTIQEARVALGELGLAIAEVREVNWPGISRGIVVDQEPRPGARVSRRDPIILTVASGLGATTLP